MTNIVNFSKKEKWSQAAAKAAAAVKVLTSLT